MTESDMWKIIKRTWKRAHATRIENAISSGAADVHVTNDGKENWFELKVHRRLIQFRPSQLAWMTQRHMAGRDTWILTYDSCDWRLYSFRHCIDKKAFGMHLNKPALNTELVYPVTSPANVSEVLNFV